MPLLTSAESLRDLFQAFAAFVLVAPVLYFGYTVIQNLFFHPLRHFPGPFLAGISPLYSIWAVMTEGEHLVIEKLHKKYGPIIRYQPNFLLFADPKMVPVIYNRHADKTEHNRPGIPGEALSVVSTIGHKEHASSRRRIANHYSMTAARAMESMIDVRIIEWKEKLTTDYANTGEPMDFAAWTQFFAYDVISEVAFGKPFGFVQTSSDVHTLIKSFHTGVQFLNTVGRWDNLKKAMRHPFVQRWLVPDLDKKIGIGRLFLERDRLINERLELGPKPNSKPDLMQHFINAKNADGSPMPVEDVKAELLLVLFAGSDTTAATFRGLLINVLQTPGCYERLTAEIDEFVRSKGPELSVISYDDAQSLKYLTACIKESMRFSPATPILLPRAPPKGGLTLEDGRWVPENTKLSGNAHVTQRNKEVYGEDAEEFNPNRWLEDESKNTRMEKYDLHFGGGTRVCLGKNIAYLEIWKAGFEFFRAFKPTLIEPEKIKFRNIGLLVHADLWVNIQKRG